MALIVSIIITSIVWFHLQHIRAEEEKISFDMEDEKIQKAIVQRLQNYEQVLKGTQGLFGASQSVEEHEWHDYITIQKIKEKFPGIQAIGYSQRIGDAQALATFLEVQKQRDPNFIFHPNGTRSEYHSIIYIEPHDERNMKAYGYDMSSEPVRNTALQKSRDTDQVSITGKITLLQEINKTQIQPGFLMILPIYKNGLPHDTVDQRRTGLQGYVYAAFRVYDFMDNIMNYSSFQDICYKIYDSQIIEKNLMFDSCIPPQKVMINPQYSKTSTFSVFDRNWIRVSENIEMPELGNDTMFSTLIPVMGYAMSWLLFFTLRLFSKNYILSENKIKTEKMAAIGELASRLAHDLRNPMSVIKISTSMIQLKLGSHIDEKTKGHFEMINRAIQRMSHQIDDVMDFIHVKSLVLAKASLLDVIESAIQTTPIPNNVKIIMPKNDQHLVCDGRLLQNVFSNLISNAIYAIGDADGIITFNVSSSKNSVLITMSDTGSGIPLDVLPKIFDPLFTTKSEGTGLGLVSCKNIVEMHGGTIYVSSEPGKETTFVISFPIV